MTTGTGQQRRNIPFLGTGPAQNSGLGERTPFSTSIYPADVLAVLEVRRGRNKRPSRHSCG
ncbi:hypothetical protein FHT76_008137 [Rhizobium sp. BK176]|nr:hypothetical protein [Rhizobium sp. BK399]MCS3744179.1 hypothetical protein [Rhizobium sp. BK661]MCS4096415.1 hypothetical protein [Rhizobium sp. BK176]